MMDKETREMFELALDKLEGIGKNQESMEKRQDEIFEVVKAIEHNNNTRNAEIDNLTHSR